MRLSMLDLAIVGRGRRPRDAFAASVAMARAAEDAGYHRVWYAEHHNMASIASSATSVLIAHVAAHTSTIRLGSGGVMLPNHAPLVIAEQFGTLAELHPDRIDLGLGRAPGTDQQTWRALRRDPSAAERFPHDVLELQAFLRGESKIPGVAANPGAGTNVPLYILGSSMFGAELAGRFGLPYAFASHFAPAMLQDAVERYRELFQPSEQLAEPHVIAAANAVVADTEAEARDQHARAVRRRVARFLAGEKELDDATLDRLVNSPQGRQVVGMMRHTIVGTPDQAAVQLDDFRTFADADEIMLVFPTSNPDDQLRSITLASAAVSASNPRGL